MRLLTLAGCTLALIAAGCSGGGGPTSGSGAGTADQTAGDTGRQGDDDPGADVSLDSHVDAAPDVAGPTAQDVVGAEPIDAAPDTAPDLAAETVSDVAPEVAQAPPLEIDYDALHGTAPASALPAPEFEALNYDGTPRTVADLTKKPTVMWFFPFSGTPG